MTAREFITPYVDKYREGLPTFEKALALLDEYLQGTANVKYSQFPDANLPGKFIKATDEPAGFDEFVFEYVLWASGLVRNPMEQVIFERNE